MPWKQVKAFDESKGGSRKGWCLQNTRTGFRIAAKYATAWIAWLKTKKHVGTPPAGVDVPVFFSYWATLNGKYKNWGHIGVRLANGKFWSDGQTYSSLSSYLKSRSYLKYVGWGETLNGKRVIKYVKPKPKVVVYVVKKGDTLWKIAKNLKTTVSYLAKRNKIKNPDVIYPGQKIKKG